MKPARARDLAQRRASAHYYLSIATQNMDSLILSWFFKRLVKIFICLSQPFAFSLVLLWNLLANAVMRSSHHLLVDKLLRKA